MKVIEFMIMAFCNGIATLVFVACSFLTPLADNAKPKILPSGVLHALAADQKEYCDQFLGEFKRGCGQKFQANLVWGELLIAPSGQTAILVESKNLGFCGTMGCSLYLFVGQPEGKFTQVLGMQGETGELDRIKVLKTITKDHFDIQKTWANGKNRTIYRWSGERYDAH
jgi:hypothetical protein